MLYHFHSGKDNLNGSIDIFMCITGMKLAENTQKFPSCNNLKIIADHFNHSGIEVFKSQRCSKMICHAANTQGELLELRQIR